MKSTRHILIITGLCLVTARFDGPVASDVALVKRHVAFLSAIDPPRNYRNLRSLDQGANYIATEIGRYTKSIRIQEYKVSGRIYKNVIVNLGPRAAEIVVVGAHYDVCGDQPGADDNASGVAGLILLTKHLSQSKIPLRFNYELVFYSLEEPPYFRTEHMGSAVHAASLKRQNARVKYMLSLETIGFYSDAKGSQTYPTGLGLFYPSEGNFIAAVGRRADADLLGEFRDKFRKHSPLKIITLAAPSFIHGIDFSDQLNYWAQGYTAAMVTDTAFMRNHNYHESGDRPETLDYEKIVQVMRGVYGAVTE